MRVDRALRPGLAFMTLHFPDAGRHEPAHDRRHRPASPARRSSRRRRSASRSSCAAGHGSRRGRDAAGRVAEPDGHAVRSTPSRRSAERAAVDALLGPPDSRLDGRRRARPDRDRQRRRRRTRGARRRHLLLPALHAVQDARRLDQPGRAQLRLRSGSRPAGRGLRRRDLLRAVLDRAAAAARGPRLRRHRLHGARRRGPVRRAGGAARARGRRQHGTARATWHRSPCLGLCERAPAALVTDAGEAPGERVLAPADAPLDALSQRCAPAGDAPAPARPPRCRRPATRLRLLAASAASTRSSLDAYRARGRLRGAARRPLEHGRRRRDPRGQRRRS